MLLTRLQILLLCLVMVTAVMVVAIRHQNRLVFVQLQAEEEHRDALQAETGRLILEWSTWTRQNNLEDAARQRLGMQAPAPDQIVTLPQVVKK